MDLDHVLSLEEIAAKIIELSKQPAGESPEVPEDIMVEIADDFKKKADDIDYHVRVIRDFVVSGKAFDNKAFDNKRRAGDEPLRLDTEKFPKPDASDTIL